MIYEQIVEYFEGMTYKTKDIVDYGKKLTKNKVDVSELKEHVLEKGYLHRIFFQVSLSYLKTNDEKFAFVEDNMHLMNDWWHVDQLLQMFNKPLDFNDIYKRAKNYVNSPLCFERRFGYVIFIAGLQEDTNNFEKIVGLFKNDEEYYVKMAMAWLLADLCVYSPEKTVEYIKVCSLKYDILGKAIQKIQDSFRISKEIKEECKKLREKVKNN